jgi:hypothetical protein
MNLVELLWNSIIEYGFNVRKSGIDGLAAWNKLKDVIKEYKINCEWLQIAIDRYTHMTESFGIKDNNKEDLPKDKHAEWEVTHFFFQHTRIPHHNDKDCNFVRFMQIAYNAGQLKAEDKSKYYKKEWREFYEHENLSSHISYLSQEHIEKINSELGKKHQLKIFIDGFISEITESSEISESSSTESKSETPKKQNGGKYKYKKYLNKTSSLNDVHSFSKSKILA